MNESLLKLFPEGFRVGTAILPEHVDKHGALIKKHFNSITVRNHLKFGELQPEEGRFTFENGDKIVDFAVRNNMKVRGHALVWHHPFVTPDWLFLNSEGMRADKKLLLNRLKNHIMEVLTHYKGKIDSWDVVNEAVGDYYTEEWYWKKASMPNFEKDLEFEDINGMRFNQWYSIAGEEYVEKAFKWAYDTDPGLQLFYNDYNNELPGKREKIYNLIKRLKEKDTPVHAMGIQGHYNIHTFPYEDIRIAIELYASLGLKIQFTEVDLSFYRWNHPQGEIMQQNDPRMMDLFEKAYNKIFSLCNEYRDVLEGITFWGVTDSDTWMLDWPIPGRQNWPLLFNTKGALKSFAQKQISQRMY